MVLQKKIRIFFKPTSISSGGKKHPGLFRESNLLFLKSVVNFMIFVVFKQECEAKKSD